MFSNTDVHHIAQSDYIQSLYDIFHVITITFFNKEVLIKIAYIFRETNDGGVVNDQQIREFTNARFAESLSQCQVIEGEKDCIEERENKYSGENLRNFTLVSYNPALGDGLNGIQILQQSIPMRTSKIIVRYLYTLR